MAVNGALLCTPCFGGRSLCARAGVVCSHPLPLGGLHPWPSGERTMIDSFTKCGLCLPCVQLRAQLWERGIRRSSLTLSGKTHSEPA